MVEVIRNRIVELRRVRAGDLLPSPHNWRTHNRRQIRLVRQMLARVGYVQPLMARETDRGLELVDGHLRAGLDPDQVVPVLIVDLNDVEARETLATFDPIKAMVEVDHEAFQRLLDEVEQGMPKADLAGLGGSARKSLSQRPDGNIPISITTEVECPHCGQHFLHEDGVVAG